MSASNNGREEQFTSCLLMLGPKPRGEEVHGDTCTKDLYRIMQGSFAYRDAVERWWCVYVLQPDELREALDGSDAVRAETVKLLRERMDGMDSWIEDFYNWQDRVVSEGGGHVH